MNFRLLGIILILGTLYSCSKKADFSEDQPETQDTSPSSSTILYIDTAKIYSTDLNGANRKLLIGQNSTSDIKKIICASILPESGNILYAYLPKSSNLTKIAVTSPDGSTNNILKEVTATVQFVKGISQNRIYYGIHTPFAGSFEFRWMNSDASSDARINYTPLYPVTIGEEEISREGRGFLINGNNTTTFMPLFNNYLSENESKTILSSASDFATAPILSHNAKKIAYVLKSATTGQYSIKVKDFSVNGPEETVYTLTVPSAGTGAIIDPIIRLYWVNGTKNLLISYGKFSSPSGAASDYTYCQLLDIASATVSKSWSFSGDGNVKVIAD